MQVFLVFFAFFMTTYWLFKLANAQWIMFFAPIFEPIQNFVHIFYQRIVTIDTVTIDFSFLIGALAMLATVYGLKYVIEGIEYIEGRYDILYLHFKKKAEKAFNIKLENSYLSAEQKNKNALILIKFYAKNLSMDYTLDRNADEGAKDIQKAALIKFYYILMKKFKFEEKIIDSTLLIYLNDIEKIDEIIVKFEEAVTELKKEFLQNKWRLVHCASIDVYSDENEIFKKCKGLISLIKLKIHDKLLCLATFKQRYLLIRNPKLFVNELGVYRIGSNNNDIYYIKTRDNTEL